MVLLKAHDKYGWVTCRIEGRYVQAKVYDQKSSFGINGGRVSKLSIGKTAYINSNLDFLEQMDFNYDRGADFNHLPRGVLGKVLVELEALPPCPAE